MPMPATYDRELALEVLAQISDAIQKIKKRFDPVNSAEQFTNSDEGMEKLDAISKFNSVSSQMSI